MKVIPAMSILHGRIAVVQDGTYEYLLNDAGQFRSPIDAIQELPGEELFILDIDGLERSSPNLGVLKNIAAFRNIWVDAGSQDVDDMMDLFVNDAEYVILGTKSIRNLGELELAAEYSDRVIFSIDYDGGIISTDPDIAGMGIEELAAAASKFRGLDTVIFMDLGSHRRGSSIDLGMAAGLTKFFKNVYVSAHMMPHDYRNLESAGMAGLIRDFRKLEVENNE